MTTSALARVPSSKRSPIETRTAEMSALELADLDAKAADPESAVESGT